MANISLPRDNQGYAIQALAPDANVIVAIGAASANVALPTGAEVVRISAPVNCYIKFGTAGVTATGNDPAMNTGAEVFRVPTGATHIAAIQNGAVTGNASITKMV